MGYELHIRRDAKDNKITVKEWTNYIENAPDFVITHELEIIIPSTGSTLQMPCPNCGLWKYDEESQVPFTYNEKQGSISVKNPDERIIKKMIEISRGFGARVFGDEGEEYDERNLSGRI